MAPEKYAGVEEFMNDVFWEYQLFSAAKYIGVVFSPNDLDINQIIKFSQIKATIESIELRKAQNGRHKN